MDLTWLGSSSAILLIEKIQANLSAAFAPKTRRRIAKHQDDEVPRVTEAPLPPFWHLCHPLTLEIQKVALLGKSAERRKFQRKDDLG